MTALPTPALLAITDRRQAVLSLPDLAEGLFAAGLRWLSLREKDLPANAQVALARELMTRARPWGATVTLHGDPSLALAAGAAGVHLSDGGDPAAARRLLGDSALIGVSAHSEEGLSAAEKGGADYATLSPVYPSYSKPGYGPLIGPDGLRRLAAASPVPVVALGGVDPDNAGDCMDSGAAGVAVMGTLMRDPGALAGFLKCLEKVR